MLGIIAGADVGLLYAVPELIVEFALITEVKITLLGVVMPVGA